MYCPQCSQQQISNEMRFCSKCGFPLTSVRELIAAGGAVVAREDDNLKSRRSIALKGARSGGVLMLSSLPIAILVIILTAINDELALLFIVPLLMIVVGFCRILFGVFFQNRTKGKKDTEEPRALPTTTFRAEQLVQGRALQLSKSKQTSEVRQPASVTENTTRLLDDDLNTS